MKLQDNDEFKEIERKFCGGGSHQKRRSSESSEFDNAASNKHSGHIKHYRYQSPYVNLMNKKPKDLKRAIGKLEKEDWNIKSIEEKLLTKKDPISNSERDKVPKWSKAAFQDKFNIMKGKLDSQTDPNDGSKYFQVKNLKNTETFWLQGSFNHIDDFYCIDISGGGKYSEVDATLAKIQKKLREGSVLETGRRGSNKVQKN